MSELKISNVEILSAIEESGYLIEQRVEPVIQEYGYLLDMNDGFKDNDTGKTREIDFTGLTARVIEPQHVIFPFLIGECENNKQPVVFFRNESKVPFLHHEEIKFSGIPTRIYKSQSKFERFIDFFGLQDFHHYCQGNFSTQYCSFQFVIKAGIKKWIASHSEEQHDSFQKLIKCVNYQIENHSAGYHLPKDGHKEMANLQIYYPHTYFTGGFVRSLFR